MNKAVFIDKDGTLIRNVPYNVDPALITFEQGVVAGLELLQQKDFLKIVISNQPGVALGYHSEEDLIKVNGRINDLLGQYDLLVDAFYYCPHLPEGDIETFAVACNCRKPMPGLITKALMDFNIDPSSSWMIGDILNDAEAGKRAGCNTILVDNGGETEWITGEFRKPDYVVKDFFEAATIICKA